MKYQSLVDKKYGKYSEMRNKGKNIEEYILKEDILADQPIPPISIIQFGRINKINFPEKFLL